MADFNDVTSIAPVAGSDAPTYESLGVAAPNAAPGSPILSPTTEQTLGKITAYGLPGLGAGLIDTMGQSLHVFGDKTVENTLKNFLPGPNGFADFYSQNKTALRSGGEIAGIALPGMLGMKVLKSVRMAREAGSLGGFLKKSSAVDALLGSSTRLSELETGISDAALNATRSAGIFTGRTFATPDVIAAKKAYYASRVADSIRTTATFEASYRSLYGSSDLFFPADYTISDQLKWGALGLAGSAGADYAMGKYAVRKLLQGAAAKAATDVAGDLSVFPRSNAAKDIQNTVFRPGNRGAGLTQFATVKNDIQGVASQVGDSLLTSNLKQDQTVIDSVLIKNIKEMARDPHPILPKTTLSDDQVKLGMNALQKNETSFLFATKLGQVPESQTDFYATIADTKAAAQKELDTAHVQAAIQSQTGAPDKAKGILDKALKSYNYQMDAANEIHYVIENDGRYNVYANRAPNWLDTHSFADVKRQAYYEPVTGTRDVATGKPITAKRTKMVVANVDTPFELHDNFRLQLPKQNIELDENGAPIGAAQTPKLSQDGYSALYAAASKLINDWEPAENQRFILTDKLPWRQTEMTLALANAHPEAAKLIDYGGTFTGPKDAMFHVLNEKYKEFTSLMPMAERAPVTTGTSLLNRNKITPAQVFQRLNMPEPLNLSAHPMVNVFAAGRVENQPSLADMFVKTSPSLTPQADHPLDLFNAAMKEGWDGPNPPKDLATVGPLLSQSNTKPIFVSARATPNLVMSDLMLHNMIETRRDLALSRLAAIDPKAAPLVSTVTNYVAGTPSSNVARQVQTLHEGISTGRGVVVPQDRINEQFPTLKAAQLISQESDRLIDQHVVALTKDTLTPKVGAILKPTNKGQLFDFNRVEQSYRHGWDIEKVEQSPAGGVRFKLAKDSPLNERLKGQYFANHDIDEEAGGYMPDMSVAALRTGYTPLTVSPEAGDIASTISKLSRQSGIENNALRVALGQPPIKIRDFHLPTPELFKEDTYFIRNSSGDVVATYTGNTAAENKRRAVEDAGKLTDATKEMHVARPLDDVRAEHSLFDRAFFNVINYSDQLAKSGYGIRGGLANVTIDTGPETLKAMIKSLHQQFLSVGIRSRASIFEPEMNYARQAGQIAGPQGFTNEGNIWERYQAIMLSKSTVGPESKVRGLYDGVSDFGDKALSWLYAHFAQANARTPVTEADARGLKAFVGKQSTEGEMRDFKANLSDWSPFQTTQDWLDSTYKQVTPPSARSVLAKLSLVSSTMSLRFLDLGTVVNNLLGTMTTAPAVVYGMRRLPGEAHADWINRTAAWGTQLADGVITFSPMKAMAKASRDYWSGALTEPMADAAKLGSFDPEYAALAKVLTEPVKGGKGSIARWADYASYAADKSEIFSRKLAWGIGYSIGKDLHKFEDPRSLYTFANNFMNETIGNYSAQNKPAMFQGAVGLPLGAFQTWMFNFYRRMYGYLERGDVKSLAVQYATQASLFGAKSVPGWSAWNSAMFQNQSGADDQQSRIERNFSPGVSELLLNGSLSGIPAIFGYDSPAFYTRGSVDIQPQAGFPFVNIPTLLTASKAPPIQFLSETFNGIKATIDNIFGAGGYSPQQQEEILANFTTNRALKNIMELAANAKTDAHGQVVDYGTRDAIHVASAIAGAWPSSTRHLQDAYIRQQQVELTQSDLRAKLNDKTRALIRGGEFDVNDFQDIAQSYLQSGGNPAYLGEWLRNTQATATTPKAITKMGELGRSGRFLEFMNMLATIQQHQ